MSHIANTLDTLIRACKPKITGADLSRATGIHLSQISRIRNGQQIWVSPEHLYRISLALVKEPKSERFAEVHAELLYARLKDDCIGPGSSLITIDRISDAPTTSKDRPTMPRLAPTIQESMDIVAEHIGRDPIIRDLVSTAAKLCRRKPNS